MRNWLWMVLADLPPPPPPAGAYPEYFDLWIAGGALCVAALLAAVRLLRHWNLRSNLVASLLFVLLAGGAFAAEVYRREAKAVPLRTQYEQDLVRRRNNKEQQRFDFLRDRMKLQWETSDENTGRLPEPPALPEN